MKYEHEYRNPVEIIKTFNQLQFATIQVNQK